MSLCLNCRSLAATWDRSHKHDQVPKGESCDHCGWSRDGLPSIDEVREWAAKKMREEGL